MDRSENQQLLLFAPDHDGADIARFLGCPVGVHEERRFEDGELKIRPLTEVSGRHVHVLQSLYGRSGETVHDKLCRLLFFVGALKDAGAGRVDLVAPYLCYARKDRRTKEHDPLTIRYVASLLESLGTDMVVTLDVHNPAAFENAFRCRTVALTAAPLFVDYARKLGADRLCVVSPDPGGVKRAEQFRQALEAACGFPVAKGFVEKHRSAGILSGDIFAGEAAGATALIVDDLISSGGTLVRAARAVRAAGARRVIALATHALFAAGSGELLQDPVIDRLVVTDSVATQVPAPIASKTDRLSVAELIAAGLSRLASHRSLADLLAV